MDMSVRSSAITPDIAVIGLGLIGGSLAIRLRELGLAGRIIGVDASETHAQQALERGLVDVVAPLEEAIGMVQVIAVSTPVDILRSLLPSILDRVDQQIVFDMGSTKTDLVASVATHARRGRYVASHPMWGTEYSGPAAAVSGAFEGKTVILCDVTDSDPDALEWTRNMYAAIGMRISQMDAASHDIHAAYVSHISHITSFALANTVLEKEREDDAIFGMASAGFESTVRLAKSNAAMWVPIFRQNRENVLDVLNEHIAQLRKFKSCLEKENWEYLQELILDANRIRRIIK